MQEGVRVARHRLHVAGDLGNHGRSAKMRGLVPRHECYVGVTLIRTAMGEVQESRWGSSKQRTSVYFRSNEGFSGFELKQNLKG